MKDDCPLVCLKVIQKAAATKRLKLHSMQANQIMLLALVMVMVFTNKVAILMGRTATATATVTACLKYVLCPHFDKNGSPCLVTALYIMVKRSGIT